MDQHSSSDVKGLPNRASDWRTSEDDAPAGIPEKALTVRLLPDTLTAASIAALRTAVAADGCPPHIVVDLRDVAEIESEAAEGLAALAAWLADTRGPGLTVRVRTAGQLGPLQPIWRHILIG